MRKRKQYHPSIKLSFALKLEKELLSESFIKSVPNSTIHGWRKDFNLKQLVGHEYAKSIEKKLKDIEFFLKETNLKHRKMLKTCILTKKYLEDVLGKEELQNIYKKEKVKTVKYIHQLTQQTNSNYQFICKILNIQYKTFMYRKSEVKNSCKNSYLNKCLKRHNNQSSVKEVNQIKKLLSQPDLLHWGIKSVQGYAIKKGICYLSSSTWYYYNKILKIRKGLWEKGKKPKNKPLRATFVNEIWHADITVFKTLDKQKHYIYTIKDNFSRKTLAWFVYHKVCAKIRLETLKKALNFAFGEEEHHSVRLITDGGPENVNSTIKDFIKNSKNDINHQIALKDIVFSNSMVESSYLTMKYRYLYKKEIQNKEELMKELNYFFHDHDFLKPHYAFKIHTPDEVYNGANPNPDLKDLYKEAAQKRRMENKNNACKICKV